MINPDLPKLYSNFEQEFKNAYGARCNNIFHSQFILSYDLYKSVNNLNLFYSFIYSSRNSWKTLVTTSI